AAGKPTKMDNLTHTLTGFFLSRFVKPSEENQRFHRAILCACIVGSNFPDLDFIYTSISGHPKLGYLLHHRGHTHTLPLVLPIAFASASFACLISGWSLRQHWKSKKFLVLLLFSV